jgi:hypothetical protein
MVYLKFEEYKLNHLGICNCVLDWQHKEGDHILSHSVTGDETWFYQYEPDNKCQSIKQRHVIPYQRKFKTLSTAGKVTHISGICKDKDLNIIKKGVQK